MKAKFRQSTVGSLADRDSGKGGGPPNGVEEGFTLRLPYPDLCGANECKMSLAEGGPEKVHGYLETAVMGWKTCARA